MHSAAQKLEKKMTLPASFVIYVNRNEEMYKTDKTHGQFYSLGIPVPKCELSGALSLWEVRAE